MMGQAEAGVRGPSDKEVVAVLQRLASARAHLLHAEKLSVQVAAERRRDQVRNREIEEAHATLLWAQAQVLTTNRAARAERAIDQARDTERRILRRHGYTSFTAYLDHRTSTPTSDVALELAQREFAAAQAEWEALTAAPIPSGFGVPHPTDGTGEPRPPEARVIRDEASATVVIDLTGDNPRRIA